MHFVGLYCIFILQCTVLACLHSFFLSFFLTPCSTVRLEKLTASQLVKKFPAFYGTRRFITVFTSARHLSLSWPSSIQSIPPHPTSWRSILILSSHLRLGLPSGARYNLQCSASFFSHVLYYFQPRWLKQCRAWGCCIWLQMQSKTYPFPKHIIP